MHGIGYQLTVDSISHYSSTLFTGPWLLLYPGSVSMPNVTSTMTFADPLFFFLRKRLPVVKIHATCITMDYWKALRMSSYLPDCEKSGLHYAV